MIDHQADDNSLMILMITYWAVSKPGDRKLFARGTCDHRHHLWRVRETQTDETESETVVPIGVPVNSSFAERKMDQL